MPDRRVLQVIDDPAAAETYVSKIIGAIFDGSSFTVTLGALRAAPPTTDQPAVSEDQAPFVQTVCRLTLSTAAATDLVNQLTKLLNAARGPSTPGEVN